MPLRTTKHWFGVVLDAPDASVLAHFYERLLGWTLYKDTPDWATLASSETAGYNLSFQTEPNYVRPVWPSEPGKPIMMLHLDLEVDDLEAAVAYAVEVGAGSPTSSLRRTSACCSTPRATRSVSTSTTPSPPSPPRPQSPRGRPGTLTPGSRCPAHASPDVASVRFAPFRVRAVRPVTRWRESSRSRRGFP